MKRRVVLGFYALALGLFLFSGASVMRLLAGGEKDDAYQQLELFARVLERVRRDHVDGEKLSYRDLVQGALKGMLSTLDPHSEFMEATKYEDLKQDTEGTYGGVIAFEIEGAHPHDVAQIMDGEGICVRAGHHCAMPLHEFFNLPATTRASFYVYNTPDEVDRLVQGIAKVRQIFKG